MLKLRELQEISGPETQEALLFLANYCKDTGALQEAQQYCTSSERPNPWLRRGRTPGSAAAEPLAPPRPNPWLRRSRPTNLLLPPCGWAGVS